jgi:hypothetical protein
MGYSTDFSGQIQLSKPLTDAQYEYLCCFSKTRRMKHNADALVGLPDPLREAVGLPIGEEGCYFTGGEEQAYKAKAITEYNYPPNGQPGLWCQWLPADMNSIEWDGGQKFYYYVEWMDYLIKNFIKPWGIIANGEIEWEGEEHGDLGKIIVKRNKVSIKLGKIIY